MASLMDSLSSLVTPQLVGSLASRLGESESAVQKGITGGVASVLSALAGQAGNSGFLGNLLSMLNGPGKSMDMLGALGSIASGSGSSSIMEQGGKFLSMALGSNQSGIASAVASAAGLKAGSASGLMGMIGPLVMGMLAKRVQGDNLNAASLGNLLSGEASGLRGLLPAGVSGLLGSVAPAAAAVASGGSKWLWPVIIGLGVLGALYWFLNQPKAPPVQVPQVAKDAAKSVAKSAEKAVDAAKETAAVTTTAVGDAARSAWAALGDLFKRKLPDGTELNIPKLGVENKVLDFIADASKQVDKTTWFDMDRLLFDTGKATLQAASQEQLQNFANIMKAYPKVSFKIGGYTDNTGDKAANLKLSQERANNVMAEIVKLGVDGKRLEAEGYGEAHPVADNATEEGRQKNRRIAVRVTQK